MNSYAYVNETGEVQSVKFECVPSFVIALDESVHVEGIGDVKYDLSYGGAFYAYVDADEISLSLDEHNCNQIIDYGKRIKQAVIQNKKQY